MSEIGSNFVSNYPPYAVWSGVALPAAQQALHRPAPEGTPLGVYAHVPFCRKRCRFCYFKVTTDAPGAEVRETVEALVAEAELYAQAPRVQGRQAGFVYIGGGTPSYLSSERITRLLTGLRGAIPWAPGAEVTFECEPGTLRAPKVEALRELGVTRLSLGVESFDDAVLERNGRAHRADDVRRALDMVAAAGFPQLNLDLIAGLPGETDASWRAALAATVAAAPSSVTIYPIEVPPNTAYAHQLRAGEDPGVPGWPARRARHAEAIAHLQAAGYRTSSAYTLVRGGDVRFVYRDALWTGAELLPLGVSAFGTLGGVHIQNHKDLATWREAVLSGQLAWQRGWALTDDEALTRQFILQLKLGQVPFAPFRERFGVDPLQRFAAPLHAMVRAGQATLTQDAVTLSHEALLQVDSLLPMFYDTRFPGARDAA